MTLHHEVRGDGPAVLLVHAGIADSRMWAPLGERLIAAGYAVVSCDLPGFGRTPLPPGTISPAADLVALLDAVDLEEAAVVGASFGGLVALTLALRAPARVRALALLGAAVDEFEPSEELASARAVEEAAWDAGDLDAVAEANIRTWVTRGGRDADPAVVELVRAMQRDAFALQAEVDAELEESDPPVARRLGEIAVPALVAVGQDDIEDFHRIAARLAEELPAAGPVVTIPGAAHLPALERPDETARALIAFLGAVPPPAAAG